MYFIQYYWFLNEIDRHRKDASHYQAKLQTWSARYYEAVFQAPPSSNTRKILQYTNKQTVQNQTNSSFCQTIYAQIVNLKTKKYIFKILLQLPLENQTNFHSLASSSQSLEKDMFLSRSGWVKLGQQTNGKQHPLTYRQQPSICVLRVMQSELKKWG